MSTNIGGFVGVVLMIAGPVAALILVAIIVGAVGFMIYDVVKSHEPRRSRAPKEAKAPARSAEESATRIYLERGVARAFVILGGAFWGVASFAGLYWFRKTGMGDALLGAFYPLLATLVTLVIGWYWERTVSVLLAFASIAAVAWGASAGFEPGVWMLVTVALVGPMVTASVLFWMARSEQVALELMLASPELALAPVERSSY